MRRAVAIAVMVVIAIAGRARADEKVSISVPIFSQEIVVGIPKGWKRAFENSTAERYIIEHIPADQTLETWTDMITVQGFKDLAKRPGLTAESFLDYMMGVSKKACGDKAFGRMFPKTDRYVRCRDRPDRVRHVP